MNKDSAVFHKDLDGTFPEDEKPWIHILANGTVQTFDTEEEACAAQRGYRLAVGLDMITGEPRTKRTR